MRLGILAALVALAPILASACGTDAAGTETCKKIEEARCRRAPGCHLKLDTPVHSDGDVDACIRYYDVACLHGLASGNDPGSSGPKVQACVDMINSSCDAVAAPETFGECAFLIPPAPAPDAAAEAAADASAEAAADAGGE